MWPSGVVRVPSVEVIKHVGTRPRPHHARLSVRDEGTARLDDRIFERHVNRPGSAGMGIGLAVARDGATAIGGRLTVDEAPSTSFSLLLPRAEARVDQTPV